MLRSNLSILVAVAVSLPGCSGSHAPDDSSTPDSSVRDTGSPDTESRPDSRVGDGGHHDTGTADTAIADTSVPDTGTCTLPEPAEHVTSEVTCPTDRGTPMVDSTAGGDCAAHSDCTAGANGRCVRVRFGNVCTYDDCFTTADCAGAGGTCLCRRSDDTEGYVASRCTAGNCGTDADCGLGGLVQPVIRLVWFVRRRGGALLPHLRGRVHRRLGVHRRAERLLRLRSRARVLGVRVRPLRWLT